MRTDRALSAALTLALALSLAACDSDEGASTSVAPTATDGATATATQEPTEDAEQTTAEETTSAGATEDATGTDDADEDDADEDAAGTDDSDEDAAGGTDDAPAAATEPDDDTDDDGVDDDGDGVVGGGPAADVTPSALAAVESALGEVEGSAYRVDDREDGFWEVDVMTPEGARVVTVRPDGITVDGIGDQVEDPLDDAGRQALSGATVSLAEGVVAAVRAAQGQLDSAALEEVDGAWVWRVVVDTAGQSGVELRVDPATGAVAAAEG